MDSSVFKEVTSRFNKIIAHYQHSPEIVKSLLEEEYNYQCDLNWTAFGIVYKNTSEQDWFLLLHCHFTLLDKIELAYYNACAKL